MSIKINEKKLQKMVEDQLLTDEQARKMWIYLNQNNEIHSSFNTTHFFYFFGGLICILAMTWFMNLGWEQFGGPGLTIIGLVYMFAFTTAGSKIYSQKGFQIPGGLLYTIAVCVTPLVIYGVQRWTGFWVGDSVPSSYRDYHVWIKGSFILMSLGTIVVGGLYLRKVPFGFLTLPISVALFYVTMDIVPLIHSDSLAQYQSLYDLRKLYSMVFGGLMLLFSYFIDRKEKEDYSFWLYLFGMMAFWGGLSLMESDSEVSKFFYFLINISFLFLSLFLHRKVFMVFGAIGVMGYFFHLAEKVFRDSLLFPFALTLLGLAVMYIGIKYQKNRARVDAWFTRILPKSLAQLRPEERG